MEGDSTNQQTDPTIEQPESAAAQGTQGEPDYKALYEKALAESRKWEGRSKANKKELDELKSQPAPDRTVEERLAALEDENKSLKASAARNALVDSVAKATGLDRSIVSALNGADEEALTEQAQAIAAQLKPAGGAPKVPEAGSKQQPGKPSKKDILDIKDAKERRAAIAANMMESPADPNTAPNPRKRLSAHYAMDRISRGISRSTVPRLSRSGRFLGRPGGGLCRRRCREARSRL